MNFIEFSRGYGKGADLLYRALYNRTVFTLIEKMIEQAYEKYTPCFPSLLPEVTEGLSEKNVRELVCQTTHQDNTQGE
ncbi:MAG: hypothetical protein J6S14_15345 [Clostridia bacterium]|nr:hypothetical protein [Clostridia bacterium]